MKKELYVDGISQIHFVGGMVRVDLFTLEPQANGDPQLDVIKRLVMTPQGFLNTFATMQQLAEKLVETGVLQKNQEQNKE